MTARRIHCETLFVSLSVDDFHFCKANSLLVARRGRNTGDHHELDQLLGLECQFPSLGLLEAVL